MLISSVCTYAVSNIDLAIKSHGEVKYVQDNKEVLIDALDIKNLSQTLTSLDEDVSHIRDNLGSLLPEGEEQSLSNISSLITQCDADSNAVLEGTKFASSNGIYKEGNIPIKEDITVSSTEITNHYDSANETITVDIPKGYYDGKSVTLDVAKYNSTIYAKGYQAGTEDSAVDIVATYNYHKHSLSKNNLTESAPSFNDWQNAISGLNDNPSQTQGGCYQQLEKHKHTGSDSSGGGCYSVQKTGYKSCSGCVANTYYCGGCGSLWYCGGCTRKWVEWPDPNCPGGMGGEWRMLCNGHRSCSGHTTYSCPGNHPYTYYVLGCNKTEDTVEGYAITCGHSNGELLSVLLEY